MSSFGANPFPFRHPCQVNRGGMFLNAASHTMPFSNVSDQSMCPGHLFSQEAHSTGNRELLRSEVAESGARLSTSSHARHVSIIHKAVVLPNCTDSRPRGFTR